MRYAYTIGGAALFAVVAAAMATGATAQLDETVRGAVHSIASPLLTALALMLSLIGSNAVWIPATAFIGALLWLAERRAQIFILLMAMAGATVWENGLKFIFHRLRPAGFFAVSPPSYRFTSGHALFAVCFYGVMAALAAREFRNTGMRTAIWLGALLLTACIGLSRIYLGSHYPSDVLAGWLAGGAWLAFLWASGAFSFPRNFV